MQTFRLLPAVAAIALCASPFLTRADDTPAQAAARAALMQDENETGNVETATPPPAIPPQTPPPASVPPSSPPMNMETNMPVATPPPAATVPATAPVTAAPAAAATQGSSTSLVVPPVEQEVPPTNQVTQYPVNPAPGSNTTTTQAAAMSALTGENGANEPSANQTPNAVSESPVTAPPLPISESQQQQLQALLQQYVANQITASQYQAGRAKILAGQ